MMAAGQLNGTKQDNHGNSREDAVTGNIRSKLKAVYVLAASMLCWPAAGAAPAEELGLYEKFAMDPQMTQVAVSPDGKSVAAVQRFSKDGDKFLRIYDAADLSAKPITLSADPMEIMGFFWANNERLVVRFRQDVDMLEDLGVYTRQVFRWASIDKAGKEWTPLPARKLDRRSELSKWMQNLLAGTILSEMQWDDDHILLLYDDDQDGVSDAFQVNVATGKAKMVFRNGARLRLDFVDSSGEPRLASLYDTGEDALIYYARLKGKKEWLEIGRTVASPDSVSEYFGTLGFFNEENPNEIWVVSNHDADTAGIFAYDIGTSKRTELLFRHPKYDAIDVATKYVKGKGDVPVAFVHHGRGVERYYFDPQEKALAAAIDAILPDTQNTIASRSRDESVIVIRAEGPRHPPTWHLLRDKTKLDELGKSLPALTPDMLSPVEWVRYKARDELEIPALVTVPEGKGPFPAVVLPHGGPVAREVWGFSLWPQLLANHGYVVIQPQFRISEGFGRAHLEAGFAQWGLALQDDLEDATQYLVKRGLADPERLAIFGWSYGGYAAFVGSARDPNPYKCAISGAGVADLPFFRARLADFGDLTEKAYRTTVDGLNALDMAKSVDVPLLVIHGTQDERVPVAESRKFVAQLKKHGKQHEYIELKGANHFYGTIYYRHWMQMFPAMIDWLDNTCGLKG